MLADFTIKNFRGIKELTLPSLKRVNLFVGKNGVGKTSVLEALWVFARRSPGGLWWAIRQRDEDRASSVEMQCVLELFHGSESRIDLLSKDNSVVLEHKMQAADQVGGLPGDPDALVLGIFQSGKRHWYHQDYLFSLAEEREARSAAPKEAPLSGAFVGSGGLSSDQLKALWDQLLDSAQEQLAWEMAKQLQPAIQEIVVSTSGVPLVKLHGREGRSPLKRQGDGVWRAFGLGLALVAARDGILIIDEVENGIHYSVQGDFWRFLLAEADRLKVQVFATTHSRDAVYALAEASGEDDHIVYRLERHKDSVQAIPYGAEKLDAAAEMELELR